MRTDCHGSCRSWSCTAGFDPPASTSMLGQQLTGTEIERGGAPIEAISPHPLRKPSSSPKDGGFAAIAA